MILGRTDHSRYTSHLPMRTTVFKDPEPNGEGDGPIVPIAPAELATTSGDPARNPVVGYLARLGASSRRTMLGALTSIARLLAGPSAVALTLPWQLLQPAHTSALRSRLVDLYSPSTANRMLAALRGVLREAWRLGLLSAEQHERLRDLPPAPGSRLLAGRQVAQGELRALFAACDVSTIGRRNAALLALGYGGGLRRSEIVGLDLGDVDLVRGSVRVVGKGGKDRLVWLASGAPQLLGRWIEVRGVEAGPLLLPVRRSGAVVGRRLSAQAVLDALRGLAARAGVAKLSPHDLRRSWVGDLLDAGADLASVQRLAGHSSPSTTSRYDRRPEGAKQRAASLLHVPLAP